MNKLFDRPLVAAVVVLLALNLLNLGLLRIVPALTSFSWAVGAILVIYGAFSLLAGGVRSETVTRGYIPEADKHTERLHRE